MLTYCTNIHPADSWHQVARAVWPRVLQVKGRVQPIGPFPVGLRLSARAARGITPWAAAQFGEQCRLDGCFIPSLNGFPYGSFHGERVKESAYLPDWRSRKRVEYTADLIRLLRLWLPEKMTGSISTVPIGFRKEIARADLPAVRENLLRVLEMLEESAAAGKKIILALEPEPGCLLETAADLVCFLEELKLPEQLRPLLGICYDCCHAAVLFQDPRLDFSRLKEAGIPVAKIQLSSAVRITKNHLQAAGIFDEPRYLHQTTIKRGAGIFGYPDLGAAFRSLPHPGEGGLEEEWRIHFHLPIFDDGNDSYGTTNVFIGEVLSCRPPEALLEIETYSYQVLPDQIRPASLIDSISREFSWLRPYL